MSVDFVSNHVEEKSAKYDEKAIKSREKLLKYIDKNVNA
jgi:hypothetical protein